MRALDAIAYNEACDSIGKNADRVKVTFFQSVLSNIYAFNGTDFAPARTS